MKNLPIKLKGLKYTAILTLIAASFAPAVLAAGDNDSKSKEILSIIEQKMQKAISIDASNLPIDQVIRQLAEQANLDVILSPKVTGNVNVGPLKDVPLGEALKSILAANGYDYILGNNMIRVVPADEVTEAAEKLVNRIYRITYADVNDVEKTLQKFISKRGSVSCNVGTSNVIVTDTESNIKAIDTFIAEIDRITPQILVEARIYDITSKDRLDLGVKWEAGTNTTYRNSAGTDVSYSAAGQPPSTHLDRATNRDPFMTSGFSGTTGKTESTAAAIRFGWLNKSIDVDMMLRAQQENIDAKLLANPRILVLDNKQAVIKIISEIPYQELTESAMGGSMGTTAFREVGVELIVTPHLTRDDMIKLRIQPKFSVVTGEVLVAGASGSSIPQPVVDRREADTTLLIRNGLTVVLGGLRKKEATRQINKVPLLGDLPLVGLLFRFKGEEIVTSELVVFITPWIVQQPVMSEAEQEQFQTTEFTGPQPINTGGK